MKIIHFYHFDSDPRFHPILLYVRWKSWVTFVRRCFRDGTNGKEFFSMYPIRYNQTLKIRLTYAYVAILNFVRDLQVSTVPRKSLASDIFLVKESSLFQEEQSRKNGHLILVLSNTAYQWLAKNGFVSSLPWTKITPNLSRVCHMRTTEIAVDRHYLLIS